MSAERVLERAGVSAEVLTQRGYDLLALLGQIVSLDPFAAGVPAHGQVAARHELHPS